MSIFSEKPMLTDMHGRTAGYLRLSITDRCNFSCRYCRGDNRQYIPHAEILRYEELLRFAGIAHGTGVNKIRITGGEPFMRKDCMSFLLALRASLPDTQICITTNGILLEPWLNELQKLQPGSINISLDTLDADTFKQITGHNGVETILANVEKLLARNIKVKLNAVIMKGITDGQTDNFLKLAQEMPLDIRFIEFMPMGQDTIWNQQHFLSAAALFKIFQEKATLTPIIPCDKLAGPARMYKISGYRGRIGFISPLTQHFCGSCNRLRLTSNGKLRICLFDDKEFNLRPLLRNPKISDAQIARVMRMALLKKPFGSDLLKTRRTIAVANKKMAGIGG